MWIVCRGMNIEASALDIAIEGIITTARNVDGVNKSIFTKGIGKTPHRLLVARRDVIQSVAHSAYSATLNLAMQIKSRRELPIAYEHKLAEVTAHWLASCRNNCRQR